MKDSVRAILVRVPSTDAIEALWGSRGYAFSWERSRLVNLLDGINETINGILSRSPSVFPLASFEIDYAWEIHEYETPSGIIVRRKRRPDYARFWLGRETRWIYDGE